MKKEIVVVSLIMLIFLASCSTGEAIRTKFLPAYDESKCVDSDNGINLEEQGTTQGKYIWSFATKTDYCNRAGDLVEFYCGRSKVQKVIKDCEELGESYECKSGECVEDSILNPLNAYTSLSEIKNNLQNFVINKQSSGQTTGYNVVKELLDDGYNGFANNNWKENFLLPRLSDYVLSTEQREYLILITHSLWLENENVVSWSLEDYSSEEIENLFWVVDTGNLEEKPITSLNYNNYARENYPLSEEASFKLYLIAEKFKQNNQIDTIKEIIKWQKKNFFHAYYDYGWDDYNDGQVINPAYGLYLPTSLNRLFEERITGCHENSVVFTNMLRSLNLPAVSINIQGHALTYLPTVDKYVHGDHLADFVTIPAEYYLLTTQDVEAIISSNHQNYDLVFKEQFPFPQHYFTNIELHRNQDNLFLETDSVCSTIPADDWQLILNEVPEFNLQYDQDNCLISSDEVSIQTLEQLSN